MANGKEKQRYVLWEKETSFYRYCPECSNKVILCAINQAQSFVTCSNSFTSSSFLCSRLAFAVFNFSTFSISCEEKDSKSNKGLDIRENCSANSMTKFQCTFFKSLSSFSFSVTSLAVFPSLLPPRKDWVFSLTFAFSNSCWYSRQKNAFK